MTDIIKLFMLIANSQQEPEPDPEEEEEEDGAADRELQ